MAQLHQHQTFLILRPGGHLYEVAKERQRSLASRHNLYQRLPMLHVTLIPLEVMEKGVWVELQKRVASIVQESEPIPLYSQRYKCYAFNNRSVTLLLQKTPSLLRISQHLWSTLQDLGGINFLGPSLEEREFHITLASTLFADNPWSEEVFSMVCQHLDEGDPGVSGWATSLEIWRPRLLPQEAILASFPLSVPFGAKK